MEELEEMLKAGIIEPSKSEWAFLIVVVKKKDGKARRKMERQGFVSTTGS